MYFFFYIYVGVYNADLGKMNIREILHNLPVNMAENCNSVHTGLMLEYICRVPHNVNYLHCCNSMHYKTVRSELQVMLHITQFHNI